MSVDYQYLNSFIQVTIGWNMAYTVFKSIRTYFIDKADEMYDKNLSVYVSETRWISKTIRAMVKSHEAVQDFFHKIAFLLSLMFGLLGTGLLFYNISI